MSKEPYDGGYCPCCGEERREYLTLRGYTCTDCDSWVWVVGHAYPLRHGGMGFRMVGRYPLGPMDDVSEEVARLVEHALSGSTGLVR